MKGKVVLDLGCGMGYQRPDGLFYNIAAIAGETVGVELQQEIVDTYTGQGYDVKQGDVQQPVIRDFQPGHFDVVWCGEIIEHLDNFAGLFDNIKYHLKDGGLLIMSTINAFAFTTWFRTLFNQSPNKEHTCWFDEKVFSQLLTRNGFYVESVKYIHHRGHWQFWHPWRLFIRFIKCFLPDRVCWNHMVIIAKK